MFTSKLKCINENVISVFLFCSPLHKNMPWRCRAVLCVIHTHTHTNRAQCIRTFSKSPNGDGLEEQWRCSSFSQHFTISLNGTENHTQICVLKHYSFKKNAEDSSEWVRWRWQRGDGVQARVCEIRHSWRRCADVGKTLHGKNKMTIYLWISLDFSVFVRCIGDTWNLNKQFHGCWCCWCFIVACTHWKRNEEMTMTSNRAQCRFVSALDSNSRQNGISFVLFSLAQPQWICYFESDGSGRRQRQAEESLAEICRLNIHTNNHNIHSYAEAFSFIFSPSCAPSFACGRAQCTLTQPIEKSEIRIWIQMQRNSNSKSL